MEKQIALLRGVNVGGHRKMPMAVLREMATTLGLKNVQTYIQSGNMVFDSPWNTIVTCNTLENAIAKTFGFQVPVLMLNALKIQNIVDAFPMQMDWKEKSYYTLFYQTPTQEAATAMLAVDYPGEHIKLASNCLYFYSEHGYGKAKLNNTLIERKLEVQTTTRNYRTLMRLIAMAG